MIDHRNDRPVAPTRRELIALQAPPPIVTRFDHRLLSWQGIVAAAAVSIGLLFLGTSFWASLAYSSDRQWFLDNLAWLNAGTAIASLLIAGLLAGYLGRRGSQAGVMNGLTVWGVLVSGSVVFGVGSALPLTTLTEAGGQATSAQPGSFWPTFVAYGIGLVTAIVGGMLGGLARRAAADDDLVIDVRDTTLGDAPTLEERLPDLETAADARRT